MTARDPSASVKEATRNTMRANRGRDTGPELAVRRLLHAAGLRYRVGPSLPFDRRRRADVFFPRSGLYVFIDGCYWHGCEAHFQVPKTNSEFWATKILGNRARDEDTNQRLRDLGFTVLRFWEHVPAERVAAAVERVHRRAVLDAGAGDRVKGRSELVEPSGLALGAMRSA